jgi:phytol kinase
MPLLLSLAIIASLLLVTEYLWRKKIVEVETSRKMVHIGTGVVIAFWPYILDWWIIQALSLVMLIAIFISFKFHIFKSIHSVQRMTRGEILFPIGVGLCALLEPPEWVFTAAILHLALADGMAALVGIRFGKDMQYTVWGNLKSVAGSAAFFITSVLIFVGAVVLTPQYDHLQLIGWFVFSAVLLTVAENVSPYGLDDLTVPVGVVLLMTTFLPS